MWHFLLNTQPPLSPLQWCCGWGKKEKKPNGLYWGNRKNIRLFHMWVILNNTYGPLVWLHVLCRADWKGTGLLWEALHLDWSSWHFNQFPNKYVWICFAGINIIKMLDFLGPFYYFVIVKKCFDGLFHPDKTDFLGQTMNRTSLCYMTKCNLIFEILNISLMPVEY